MHMVDRMLYAGEVPWHGLGEHVEDCTADTVREIAFPWIVERKPLYLEGDPRPIEGFDALTRSDNGYVLTVQPKTYQVVQYQKALEVLEAAAKDGGIRFASAGTLDKGRKGWALAYIPSAEFSVAGSEVKPYLLMSTAHDGTMNAQYHFTATYVVCNNTLTAALASATDGLRIRHTRNANRRIEDASALVAQARDFFGQFHQVALNLVARRMNAAQFTGFARELFPRTPAEERDGIQVSLHAHNVTKLYCLGRQRAASNAPGTRWAAYNAVTEYLDHHINRRTPDSRFKAIMFGDGAKVRQRALETLLAA